MQKHIFKKWSTHLGQNTRPCQAYQNLQESFKTQYNMQMKKQKNKKTQQSNRYHTLKQCNNGLKLNNGDKKIQTFKFWMYLICIYD